ncbi:MAG: amino acid adenylation domain-containing protein, partial [Cyanobacteria bacterium J06555_13]
MQTQKIDTDQFISRLRDQGINLKADGEKLLFDAAKGAMTPTLKQEIAARKVEVLKRLQTRDRLAKASLRPLQPVSRDQALPLSLGQERLWFVDQLDGENSAYNASVMIRMNGDLNIQALKAALSAIVNRHEILRTSFPCVSNQPTQCIHPEATFDIELIDLQNIKAGTQEAVLQQQLQESAIAPFDLEIAPPIRSNLWQLSVTEHMLLLTMHYIIADGWSMGVLTQELSRLYQDFCAENSPSLPALPIQYADYAVWQREWLSPELIDTQLNYWKQQLAGAPQLLQLPTDRPRPNQQTYQGKTKTIELLNVAQTQELETLSQQSGMTLFMTLQAAFSTLLYRYSGQSDILMGTSSANRNRSELESLVGFFINTLVLRTRFEDNPSFATLLTQVRETTLEAYQHQETPFGSVVEALQPKRSLSYSPLIQVQFLLQNAPLEDFKLANLTSTASKLTTVTTKFDLTLSITKTHQGLVADWEYSTDLFDESTIERMAAHLQSILSAIIKNPQLTVEELPLLSAAKSDRILFGWNDTATEYNQDQLIHRLFEAQVTKTPDAVAVVFEEKQLTYQELNQKANQLAAYLQRLGVKPDGLVGVCIERSVEMVIGLLGILKAGGAYVPIDPHYPADRIGYMLADSDVSVLLTEKTVHDALPSHNAQVICLDEGWDSIAKHSQKNANVDVASDNLAYVIYTSGTTGNPKGVMNTHHGIRNRLLWMQEAYQLAEGDRVLQKTPFSFDVSVWEFFWTLITGATIVVAKPEGHKDRDYLVNLIAKEKITTLHFVPSMLQVFLQAAHLEKCSCLKRVFCSGEALPFELTQTFFAKLQCELHNLYGPTEAAIDVSYWQCHADDELQSVPIGRPIANTQLHILDRLLQPVPIGVAGDLYIGGHGLARGYLNRPDLTQEKFIPNPFDSSNATRLYKTGDVARYLPDGNIDYLGRIDNQVKIRGFRIELGEIEVVLNAHPQIQQTVVIATADKNNDKRLIAYVVAQSPIANAQLRDHLKAGLPEYMVPSAFVVLDSLPLTPNGKIDRKALPEPSGDINRDQDYIAPRTPSEEIIANIFTSVLGLENIGVHDNFFELGGHSLLATQLISRLQVAFSLEIPLRELFAYPTVAQLDSAIAQRQTTHNPPTLPPIQPRRQNHALPLSWAQERL